MGERADEHDRLAPRRLWRRGRRSHRRGRSSERVRPRRRWWCAAASRGGGASCSWTDTVQVWHALLTRGRRIASASAALTAATPGAPRVSPGRGCRSSCSSAIADRRGARAACDTGRVPTLGAILTAIITPFHADGSVDEQAFVDLMHHLAASGSDGFVVCGTTGEAATLDDEEHLRASSSPWRTSARHEIVAGVDPTHRHASISPAGCELGAEALLPQTDYNRPPAGSRPLSRGRRRRRPADRAIQIRRHRTDAQGARRARAARPRRVLQAANNAPRGRRGLDYAGTTNPRPRARHGRGRWDPRRQTRRRTEMRRMVRAGERAAIHESLLASSPRSARAPRRCVKRAKHLA